MDIALNALDEKKRRKELKGKGYYPMRISKLMMYDCSFACELVMRKKAFDIPYTNKEIRDVMWHPMSFWEILKAPSCRYRNMFYYTISILPPVLSVMLLKLLAKINGRV